MVQRSWDPKNRYPEGLLKEYAHWVLEVSYRQHTLGSYIIFAKRSVERISELETHELTELKAAMADIEKALSESEPFKPDRFNYWQMGNQLHHLHLHGIPRYAILRRFDGKEWIDSTYGFAPIWSKTDVSPNLVRKIKDAITPHLPQ